MATFSKSLGETGDFFPEVGRKVEGPLRAAILTGHRALHPLPQSCPKFPGTPWAPPRTAAWTAEGRVTKCPNLTFKKSSFSVLLSDCTCQRPGWEARSHESENKTKICRAYLITVSSTQWSVVSKSTCDHGLISRLCHWFTSYGTLEKYLISLSLRFFFTSKWDSSKLPPHRVIVKYHLAWHFDITQNSLP